jgi:phage baseplate assembly protein W
MADFDLRRPAIGWPLFALPDAHGRLDWPVLERSVRDTLQALLATRPGEQLMRPDFGAGLDRLLHEPNTLATRRRIQVLVTEAVTRWEPRIVLDRVDVLEVDGEPTQIRVEIAYRLQRTGQAATLALTMTQEPR